MITLESEPNGLYVFAVEDRDGDGKCSEGELWDERIAFIDYQLAEPSALVTLGLREKECGTGIGSHPSDDSN